jgi:hypothetical protein
VIRTAWPTLEQESACSKAREDHSSKQMTNGTTRPPGLTALARVKKRRPILVLLGSILATVITTVLAVLEVLWILLLCTLGEGSAPPPSEDPCASFALYGGYLALALVPVAGTTAGGWVAIRRNRILPVLIGFAVALGALSILPLLSILRSG